jgi:putative membrane protein
MNRNFLLVLIIPVLYCMQSCDDARKAKNYNQETTVDQSGFDFINQALDGGRTEVKLSTIAQRISTNPRVLSFAKMMVSDHTKGIEELKKLRKKELVNRDDVLSPEHTKLIDSISKIPAGEFDKAYIQQMVIDHEKTVTLFNEVSHDRVAAVQALAKKTLPTIQMHLDSAKAISAELK